MVLQTTYIIVTPCPYCLIKFNKANGKGRKNQKNRQPFLKSKKDVEEFWLSEANYDMMVLSLDTGRAYLDNGRAYISLCDFLTYYATYATKPTKLEVRYGKDGSKICFIDEKGNVR